MKGTLLLDVIVGKSATILQLLTSEDQTLLIRRDALLVLDLRLDLLDRVSRLNVEGNGLASECLHEDLHFDVFGCRIVFLDKTGKQINFSHYFIPLLITLNIPNKRTYYTIKNPQFDPKIHKLTPKSSILTPKSQ
jgi:hypothetical protein